MKNKIEDLRNHLFLALEKLHDGEMEVDMARAIAEVAREITATAKVEVDFLRATDSVRGTGFIPDDSNVIEGQSQRRLASVK
jgi:hypothetical protein